MRMKMERRRRPVPIRKLCTGKAGQGQSDEHGPHSKGHLCYRPEEMNMFTFKSVQLHSLDSLMQSYLMEHRGVMQVLLMLYEL